MAEETRKKIAEQFRKGFFQGDPVAEKWADEYFPLEEKKEEKKPVKKEKNKK